MVRRAADGQQWRMVSAGHAADVGVEFGFNGRRDLVAAVLGREHDMDREFRERLGHDRIVSFGVFRR